MVTAKPGEDDGWVALRVQNLSNSPATATVSFTTAPRSARAADPVEHPGAPLTLEGDGIVVELAAREIRTVLVRFAAQLT